MYRGSLYDIIQCYLLSPAVQSLQSLACGAGHYPPPLHIFARRPLVVTLSFPTLPEELHLWVSSQQDVPYRVAAEKA